MVTDQSLKEELYELSEGKAGDDFIAALLSFGGELGRDEKGYYLFYSTHDYRLALAFSDYLQRVYGYRAEIGFIDPGDKRKKRFYTLRVKGKIALELLSDLGKISCVGEEITFLESGFKTKRSALGNAAEYVRAVYLSCGSFGRAATGSRLTLSFETEETAKEFAALLEGEGMTFGEREKDGKFFLSTRKGQTISDFFALAGASRSVLALQDKLVRKEFNNNIQRASNFSVANLDKAMSAAVRQYNDALYLKEKTSFYGIPEELVAVAEARILYPEITLEELRRRLPENISKSGLYHRLEKISEMANALREENDESDD